MNDEIKSKLEWRATIVENIDKLVKYGSNINHNQLSLFSDNNKDTIHMTVPTDVNYKEMIAKEKDVLGVCLTYNLFDRYILITKRFCNHSIRTVNELTENAIKVIFLGLVTEIEYKKSLAGNNYARITLQDNDSSIRVYLWGDMYKKLISRVYKDKVYLIETNYNKDNDSVAIINIKSVDDINIDEFVSTIVIHIDDFASAVKVRPYIHEKMFGSKYDLWFSYQGQVFQAPYKVNFKEEDYLYLKEYIIELTVSE